MKKKVLLLGYFANNMGDDLFFTILCKRYPDTLFYVNSNCRVNPSPANIRYINASIVDRVINKAFHLTHKDDSNTMITRNLKKNYDYAISLIGSGYMQKNSSDYPQNHLFEELFYKERSYVIGCNFGPYYSDEFREHYAELFSRLSGITFRDRLSYELFENCTNSLVAPDIVFGLNDNDYKSEKIAKTVVISVMDLSYGGYDNRREFNDDYKRVITEAVQELVNCGYKVTILGMCEKENDTIVANEIIRQFPEENIKLLSYPNDGIDTILSEISRSEYLVSTRFHSFVLGVVFGCKVLPISYNYKIANTIKDIGFNGDYIEPNTLEQLSGKKLVEKMLQTEVFYLTNDVRKCASQHFKYLDSELL